MQICSFHSHLYCVWPAGGQSSICSALATIYLTTETKNKHGKFYMEK